MGKVKCGKEGSLLRPWNLRTDVVVSSQVSIVPAIYTGQGTVETPSPDQEMGETKKVAEGAFF